MNLNRFFTLLPRTRRALVAVMLASLPAFVAHSVWAGPGDGFQLPVQFQGLTSQAAADPADNLHISANFATTPDGRSGLLRVTASLSNDWHIYSITQKAGGPLRTEIVLSPSEQYVVIGPFRPDSEPHVRKLDFFDVPVEEHEGRVTWTAPIRLAPDVSPESLVIRGKLNGQICQDEGGCVPLATLDTGFAARVEGIVKEIPAGLVTPEKRRTPPVAGTTTWLAAAPVKSPIPPDTKFSPAPAGGYRAGAVHTIMLGRIEPATVAAGQTVQLVLTAKPDAGWHIYAYAPKNPKAISQPTLIAVAEPTDWTVGQVKASNEPIVKQTGLAFEPEQRYHEGEVTWTVPITVPVTAKAGAYTIKGMLGYQTCTETNCDRPTGAYFAANITVGSGTGGAAPLQFAPASYTAADKYLAQLADGGNRGADQLAGTPTPTPPPGSGQGPDNSAGNGGGQGGSGGSRADVSFDLSRIEPDETTTRRSIGYILGIALLGGFILNFMPCVLPVIGLKIMSFVQQAGEHRSRVLLLNVVYSLGMLSVFWLLALLASQYGLGWGEQYNNDSFTITLLCVVFVMGLSFIGVWEIPIPGFVGSGTASELAQKEGLAGAFFKGVLTTILATPCSGPGVAAAITWSVNKPSSTVFAVFTCMGLGMALPYLIIGAFPGLVRYIPKPGAWMDTFKQLMGFVLMGTVVYLFTLVKPEMFVPTLALIFALWASCWWVGRMPLTVDRVVKLRGWLGAAAFAGVVGWFAFGYEPNREYDLPWEEYSLVALDQHIQAGHTVMVDFTANWCATCKVLERAVLNTRPVRQVVDRNKVVTLVADWSDGDPEIGELLDALGSKLLPVVAIFPADDPYHPKKLSGGYTRDALVKNLRDAGPSRTAVAHRDAARER